MTIKLKDEINKLSDGLRIGHRYKLNCTIINFYTV